MQSHDKDETTIFLARDFLDSTFNRLYQEAMTLIEITANYIDNEGKIAAEQLPPPITKFCTTQTMHLSTRLMQLASWFLLERAGKEQEMNIEQITLEKAKINFKSPAFDLQAPYWPQLPAKLRSLIEQTIALEDRIQALDPNKEHTNSNPLDAQWALLHNNFS